MKKYKTALLFGGRGFEHDVSVNGAEYAFRKIDGSLFEILPIYIRKSGEWVINENQSNISLLTNSSSPKIDVIPAINDGRGGLLTQKGDFIPIDVAFPLLHGDFGEDGTPLGALENAKIPYIGCESVAGVLCYDKIYTKIIAEHLSIPTARWISPGKLSYEETLASAEEELSYPMFVKPARLGSSIGASAVRSRKEFKRAFEKAYKLGSGRVLIEELIEIDSELECGYYGSNSKELFTKIGEIRCSEGFYDYDSKYISSGNSSVTSESSLDAVYGDQIRDYSKRLKDLIGICGISRFDFFLTRDKKILFNEINTLPGFTSSSLYPRLLESSGISVREALTELLLDKALGR